MGAKRGHQAPCIQVGVRVVSEHPVVEEKVGKGRKAWREGRNKKRIVPVTVKSVLGGP